MICVYAGMSSSKSSEQVLGAPYRSSLQGCVPGKSSEMYCIPQHQYISVGAPPSLLVSLCYYITSLTPLAQCLDFNLVLTDLVIATLFRLQSTCTVMTYPCNAHVPQLDVEPIVQEHIERLHVAVKDLARVHVVQPT